MPMRNESKGKIDKCWPVCNSTLLSISEANLSIMHEFMSLFISSHKYLLSC